MAKAPKSLRNGKSPLAIVYIQRANLKPFPHNPRVHSPEQVGKIAASIREFGWTNPVLIDANREIIAGHGRVLAAATLGIAEIPTITITGLSKAQQRALVIADNQLTLAGGWDLTLLSAELAELKAENFDLSLLGFNDVDLAPLLNPTVEGETDPDDVPDAPARIISKPGDLWLLGNHRLLCGNSTQADDVALALGGVTPPLMVTDPPYGVNYDPDWRNRSLRSSGGKYGGRATGVVLNDGNADWSDAYKLFPGSAAYIWNPPGPKQIDFYNSIVASGYEIRNQIVWVKNVAVISRGHYHGKHEGCWYAVRKGKTANWQGARDQTTVWEIDKPKKSETGHSTQKPIECMRRPMENNSAPGEWVYDPFMGSGTTIIAAEMIGRKAIGIELNPAHVDVAIIRWQNFSGQQATRAKDGATYGDLAEAEKTSQHAENPERAAAASAD